MDAVDQMPLWTEQEKQHRQQKYEGNQVLGVDVRPVLDSPFRLKSLTEKQLEVLSSKGLVSRGPLKVNRRELGRTKQNGSVPRTYS